MNTNKLISISIASALAAIAGCGTDVHSTASGVFPAQGFAGREMRVEISGDQTSWNSGATVTFSSGVVVNSVEVASPTDIFADITIDPAAAVGLQDVTVNSGGKFTLKQAFQIVSPVELTVQGNAGQGGLPFFHLTNHDLDNPFDLSTDPSTGAYANLALTGPTGVQFSISQATEFSIDGQAFIDLNAAAGDVTLTSGAGSASLASDLGSFPVTPRTGTAFTGSATGMIATKGDSVLYTLNATGTPSLVHLAITSVDPNAAVGGAIFTDGTWANAAGTVVILNGPGSLTFVVADVQGGSGYSFKVAGAGEMLTSAAEGNDTTNNTTGGALAASSLPFRQTPSTLSSSTDVDQISFTVTAADVTAGTNHLHIVTDFGNPNTDTAVEVVNSTNTPYTDDGAGGSVIDGSDCSFFGCSSLGENTVTNAMPAGTYYLKITAGAQYASTDTDYNAVIWLE